MDNSWAAPGVKCECIKQGEWEHNFGPHDGRPQRMPDYGDVFTVWDVYVNDDGEIYLYLEEISRGFVFKAINFRPLVRPTLERSITTREKVSA